ncbi:MAG: hypothetical protein KC421_05370, partial [Anaerolineales bacterium]|nr:hypothetical protein [Anaerolineales bacterium]
MTRIKPQAHDEKKVHVLIKIWHTLWFRITAAFLLVVVVGVGLVAVLANQATISGFRTYLSQDQAALWTDAQTALRQYYVEQGSWRDVDSVLVTIQPTRGQGGTSIVLLDELGNVAATAGGQRNHPATLEDATT